MAHIKLLYDRKDGSVILPRTISQAVYHEGQPLHSVLGSIQNSITWQDPAQAIAMANASRNVARVYTSQDFE